MPPTWERDVMATPRISTRSFTLNVITKVKPRKPSEFQSVLLAIAGHDPRGRQRDGDLMTLLSNAITPGRGAADTGRNYPARKRHDQTGTDPRAHGGI